MGAGPLQLRLATRVCSRRSRRGLATLVRAPPCLPLPSIPPQSWRASRSRCVLSTIGGVGMWSVVVALPAVQAGVRRRARRRVVPLHADDARVRRRRHGCSAAGRIARASVIPLMAATLALGAGYVASGYATTLWQFALAQGLLIGVGSSVTFGAADRARVDVVRAAARHRGRDRRVRQLPGGRRVAADRPALHRDVGLARDLFRHRRVRPRDDAPARAHAAPSAASHALPEGAATSVGGTPAALGLSPNALQTLIVVAAIACCVAMSMPQVHIVAYCADLGYGPARGAQMLSLMLACGIVSRLAFGYVADRVGGLRTLLIGGGLQCVALILYLPFDAPRVALRDLRAVRPVPGRHRAVLRDHRPRVLPARARQAGASAWRSSQRSSAWRSAAG